MKTTDKRIFGVCVAVFALYLGGCNTPAAVSQFCASAMTTLEASRPVFEDLKQSCLREVQSRAEFGTFTPPVQEDAACNAIGKRTDGAVAATKVLADYFRAINALASFGTAKAGSDAQNLVTKTGAAVGESSAAQTALGSIAKFVVSAATSGYQQKALAKDLPAVSGNVTAVTGALIAILQDNYVDQLLKSEEQKLTVHYKEFARGKSPEVVLILDGRWQADERVLLEKRACARNLISGLNAMSKGFADLAANAHKLKGAEVPGLLAPYVSQLQALIPQIQKAF